MPETPAERALRALVDAVDDARARRPEDADDPDVPVAATVVIARDGRRGPEVLMIERPERGSFAGAWVFPGGKIDPGDRLLPDEPEADAARRAGVRETREEAGLELDPAALEPMSRWDPPPGLPLRIRTWFFATRATGADLVLSADEAISATWVHPQDALARHARGEATLYPPTWVTLHGLTGQGDVDALLALVRLRGVEQFETVVRRTADGPLFLWQDDAQYAIADAAGEARHRLQTGVLPWRYARTA